VDKFTDFPAGELVEYENEKWIGAYQKAVLENRALKACIAIYFERIPKGYDGMQAIHEWKQDKRKRFEKRAKELLK